VKPITRDASIACESRVPVNLLLDEELVREARALAPDLAGTVEGLLAAYVTAQRLKRADEQHAIDIAVAATRDFADLHGLPGADFAPV